MKVFIADNHRLIVEGMKALLTKFNIEVEGSFKNGLEVIKWRETNNTDVLILDISMPVLNGIDVLKHFQDRKINQPTLVVSAYNDYHFIVEAMKYGANGYILKTESDNLVNAVKTIHRGEKFVSKKVVRTLLNRDDNARNDKDKTQTKLLLKDLINGLTPKLSEKERVILELLSKKYSSDEIQRKLDIKASTFRTYTSRIREKLNIKTTEDLIKYSIAIN